MLLNISRAETVSQSRAFDCMQTGCVRAHVPGRGVITILVGAVIWFTTSPASAEGPLKFRDSQFEPIKWSEQAGWTADDHLAAYAAYQTSCQALLKSRRSDEREGLSGALSSVCRKAAGLQPQDTKIARAFFEQNFQPVRIARLGEAEGLLTGYFEPVVAGSRFPTPEFSVPLYRRPRDLEAAGYKRGSLVFPNKGVRIGRRNDKNELVPYYDRAAIEAGALDGQKLEICWLKSSSDLLAIQIEGSGRVILEDSTPLRVAFDSHNGYAFSSIERVLIDRNIIARKDISTQAIRDWMATHPEEAANVRASNRSYIFFRITGLTNEGEPLGAQGVPLTPGRSIAVDRGHQYGTPFFIEADLPIEGRKASSPFRRLMIAQDTGSAIIGPARADLYWGAGEEAGRTAGRIRHRGRFVMLLPRQLDIAETAREAPLPLPRPKIAELDVEKQGGKGKVELEDSNGRGNAKTTGIGAAATGKTIPSPQPKKIGTLEAKKQDDRSKAVLDVKKQDDKGKAISVTAGANATGRLQSAPAPNTKIAVLDEEKQDGKRKAKEGAVGASATGKFIVLPVLKPKKTEGKTQNARRQQGQKDKGETIAASSTAIAAGLHNASSAAKSKTATTEIKKQSSKGKGEVGDASSTAIAVGLHKLSPSPKSKTAEIEAKKQDGKGKAEKAATSDKQKPSPTAKAQIADIEARKQDGKGGTVGVSSTTIAAGLHKRSPTPKSKSSEIEAKKQNGKGKADSASLPETAASGKQKLSAMPKKKPGIESKKQSGKGKPESVNTGDNGRVPARSPRQAAPHATATNYTAD
jgi:membrane-bound lytic murein transglycosylase A